LTQRYGFSPNNTVALYDEQATDIAIKQALGKFRQLTAEDKLIIYYSGHGYFEKPVGSIVPVNAPADTDAGFIPNSTFIDYFKTIPAKHILLILDSCFGGSFATTKDVEIDKVVERVEQKASRKFMSSGSIEEVSDGIVGTNSPFAKALVRCLEENTEPKAIISDLFQEVRKKTAYESLQLPQYETLVGVGHDGGEMVLYLNTPSVLEQKQEKNSAHEQDISVSSPIDNITQSRLFYQQGIEKLEDSKFGEALVFFNKAIQLDERFADAYYKRAAVKKALNDLKGALEDYDRTIEIEPNHFKAKYFRGFIKGKTWGDDLFK
jgi:tetratricopeptide (TPR) repeat protein